MYDCLLPFIGIFYAPVASLSQLPIPCFFFGFLSVHHSWNTLACNVDEESVKAAADLIVSLGLKDAGYE